MDIDGAIESVRIKQVEMSLKRDCKPFLHDVLALDPMGLGHVMGFTQPGIPYRFGFEHWVLWLGLSADSKRLASI